MNRIPLGTIFFCGHCEEEIVGMPAGERVVSGRPLCLRCAHIGKEEGWGKIHEGSDAPGLYEAPKRGLLLLLFLMVVSGAALFVITMAAGWSARR